MRRRLTAALIVASVVLAYPGMAWATFTTPPYAHCNVNESQPLNVDMSAQGLTVNVRCVYSNQSTNIVKNLWLDQTTAGAIINYDPTTFVTCGTESPAGSSCVTTNSSGLLDIRFKFSESSSTRLTAAPTCHSIQIGTFSTTDCIVDTFTASASNSPAWSSDQYAGQTAPPVSDANAQLPTCARTLSGTSDMTGQFTTTTGTTTHASSTSNTWTWGDSTSNTTATGASPYQRNHTYPALSTMPAAGWTATSAVTYTADVGHTFPSGSTTVVITCAVRVDFLNPDKGTSGTTDTNHSTGDPSLDDCLPSGWDLLNPLAFIGGLGCVLKVIFIPTESGISDLTHLWDTVTTKLPFSVINDAVTWIPGMLTDFRDGVRSYSPLTGYTYGGPNRAPICGATSADDPIHICGTGQYPLSSTGFNVHGNVGQTTATSDSNQTVVLLRDILLIVLSTIAVYAMWRSAMEILK